MLTSHSIFNFQSSVPVAIAWAALTAFISGWALQRLSIWAALKWNFTDIPSSRKRHHHPMPVIGGVGILLSQLAGVSVFFSLEPGFFQTHQASFLAIGSGVLLLHLAGLWDDLKGLTPSKKLSFQIAAALVVLFFEPSVRSLLLEWEAKIGWVIWPMAGVWLIGISNAINLIDGMDGLAGGMSALVGASLVVLCAWGGKDVAVGLVLSATLVPAVLSFLRYNWAPAKIYLGDNGSLPVGFMLATISLMNRPGVSPGWHSWVELASIGLMLGYPILDMGLAVMRRARKRQPLFKADRNHLHYKVLRLGLTIPQTTRLLLAIGLYLQMTAILVNFLAPAGAAFGIVTVTFSISSLLLLIGSIEKWRVRKLAARVQIAAKNSQLVPIPSANDTLVEIELETLLEAGLLEEESRWHECLVALQFMMKTLVRPTDSVVGGNNRIYVILRGDRGDPKMWAVIRERFQKKLDSFLELYNFQCTLRSIPMRFSRQMLVQLPSPAATQSANDPAKVVPGSPRVA